MAPVSRRNFIQAGTAGGIGLIVGFAVSAAAASSVQVLRHGVRQEVSFAPNAFIRIDPQGKITLVMPKVEMGQGTYTGHAMLLAEELEVSLDQVLVQASPPNDALYGDPLNDGIQMTGTSTAIQYGWEPLRRAGATARILLRNAAARHWKVDPETCHAEHGQIVHAATGRRLGYGQLVAGAAREPLPASVPLKAMRDLKLIGKPVRRVDTPDKINGAARYGIDVILPGMKFVAVQRCPVFGGTLGGIDAEAEGKALKVPGVRQVVRLATAVAVVAEHTWAARQGLAALQVQWLEGVNAGLTTARLWDDLERSAQRDGVVARNDGDATKALTGAAQTLHAVYQQPFLAHAAMEPMNCAVRLSADRCEIWVGTQVPTIAQAAVAKVTKLPVEKIHIHNHLIGGGFGRRLEVDGIILATEIALQVKAPIKVIWSREEDLQRSLYRPMYYDELSAGLGADGRLVAWTHKICGSSVTARYAPADMKAGVDPDTVAGSIDPPYDLANAQVRYVQQEPNGIPTAWWRGVGPTRSVFVVESFMDELAAAAKVDPVAYRRGLLAKSPRALVVLDLAARESGWGDALAAGRGRGVSLMSAFGSHLCAVVDVTVGMDGRTRVDRVVCAIDCGIVVNPKIVSAQVSGGIVFGLTAALYGEISIQDGRVSQTNFNDYRVLRISECPPIDVHLVGSTENPGGVGETGTAVVAAAVTNAIFAATGRRIRKLPIHSTSARV